MKYSDDCKVYRIRYYNVWFYLFAKTEMDEYKINILGERIGISFCSMRGALMPSFIRIPCSWRIVSIT